MRGFGRGMSPRKLTVLHTLISFLLIIVMFFFSLGTIFTLDVGEDKAIKESVSSLIKDMAKQNGENSRKIKVEIPDQVDVSLPLIIKSSGGAIKVLSVFGDTIKDSLGDVKKINEAKSMDDKIASMNEMKKEQLRLRDVLNQDVVNLICVFVAIFNAFSTNFVLGAAYAFILLAVITVPVACIFYSIICVVSIIKNRDDPAKAFHRVSKSFKSIISTFPLILLVKALVPAVQLGNAVLAMFAVTVAAIVLGLIISRLKSYERADIKYLNILQICSFFSFVSFAVFFVGMAKTRILEAFFENSGGFVADQMDKLAKKSSDTDIISLALMCVFIAALIIVCKYLISILTRLACMSTSKSDSHAITASIGLVLIVIPFILMKTLSKEFQSKKRMCLLAWSE